MKQEKLEKIYNAYMDLTPSHTMQLAHALFYHLDEMAPEGLPLSVTPVTLHYALHQSMEKIGAQLWLEGHWHESYMEREG